MNWCQQVGQWITDNIEKPIEQFFHNLYQICSDVRQWIETTIVTSIETWRQQQEQRCREQECNWWCLCCNKWFCWIVVVLVSIIEWVVKVIGEWLIETICKLIVTIFAVLIYILVQILKWIVLAVVCLLGAMCAVLIVLAGLALVVVLLGIVALGAPAFAPLAAPLIPIAAVIALAALTLVKLMCEISRCRLFGIVGWALKWSIVLGGLLAAIALSPTSAFIAVIYGGCIAALIVALESIGCRLPRMLGLP